MLDTNVEHVAAAMRADRLARAAHNLRLKEAEAVSERRRGGRSVSQRCRVAVARFLMGLAQRIMPPARSATTTHAGAAPG